MLTVEAAPLEFTVTESIQMSVIQGNSDLTITPVTVTNNGSEKLKVSQIEITTESGWSLASSETDFSTSDSKGKLAFTLNSHDFSGGAYTPGDELSAGGSKEYQLAGKISSQADLMAAGKVSDFVVTVEKVEIISFTLKSGDSGTVRGIYSAEKGMTWEEFINSSYNSSGDFSVSGTNVKYVVTDKAPVGPDWGPVHLNDEIRDGETYWNLSVVHDQTAG